MLLGAGNTYNPKSPETCCSASLRFKAYLCDVAKVSRQTAPKSKGQRGLMFFLHIPLAGLIALLVPSPVVGHDSWLHLIWLEQFSALVKEGVLYPRWLHLSNGGFGSPTFYFYPPLPSYIATAYSYLSTSAQDVSLFRSVGCFGTIASIFAFRYYLLTIGVENMLSWAGGLLYAILPYRAVDLVLRNALGEHLAFVWIPLVFAGIEMICGGDIKQRSKAFILTAVGFALLLISNIPTSIAIAIATPVYALLRQGRNVRGLFSSVAPHLIGALLVGALLSAFYLLPAMSLRDHIQSWHLWDAGTSRTGAAFTITDIFAKPEPITTANFIMLLGAAATLAFAVVSWRRKLIAHRSVLAWSAIILISILFQLPGISGFLYDLPVVSYLQFSWRWNILLVPAIATSLVLLYQPKQVPALLVSVMLAVTTIWVVSGFNSKYKEQRSTDVLKIEYSDAFEYIPVTATRGTHAIANFVGKHRTDPPVILNGPGITTLTKQEGDAREYAFDLPQGATATFHLFVWPLWELTVDGATQSTNTDDLGRLVAQLPPGKHTARISRATYPSETAGAWLSLVSVLGLVVVRTFINRKQL